MGPVATLRWTEDPGNTAAALAQLSALCHWRSKYPYSQQAQTASLPGLGRTGVGTLRDLHNLHLCPLSRPTGRACCTFPAVQEHAAALQGRI